MFRSALQASVALYALSNVLVAAYDPATLFPIKIQSGFTTSASASSIKAGGTLTAVALDNNALGVIKISQNSTMDVIAAPGSAPSGTMAWRTTYPQGSFNPTDGPRGGFGFYMQGPSGFDWSASNQLLFSYAVMFPTGFQFNMGGKLPGPYGGSSDDLAFACSGGRQQNRDECFDLRLMWRTNADGEVYAYLPNNTANSGLESLTGTVVDTTYGLSIARGAFKFAVGDWTVVAQRVRLNDVGATNGEIELFVNGKSVIHGTGLAIRNSATNTFRGGHMQTFFGGATADWASPVTQNAFFADISVGHVAAGASPADGGAAYPIGVSTSSSGSTSGSSTSGSSTSGSSTGGSSKAGSSTGGSTTGGGSSPSDSGSNAGVRSVRVGMALVVSGVFGVLVACG